MAANLGGNAAGNPTFAIDMSTLAAGTYQVTELYGGQLAGTVTVNSQGGFSSWTATGLPALVGNQTWMLRLRSTTATSTASAQPAFAFALFPNPAAGGSVRLALTAAPAAHGQVQDFDLVGKQVYTGRFTGNTSALDTNGWAAGTYFVRVQSGTAVAVQRLVVER